MKPHFVRSRSLALAPGRCGAPIATAEVVVPATRMSVASEYDEIHRHGACALLPVGRCAAAAGVNGPIESSAPQPPGPLHGLLVVTLEQPVAAPYCSLRLADAGARVIKIERPEGDFARPYDAAVHGSSSCFVWLNRGKQSLVADIKDPCDAALLHRMIA